jgi:uncharacterized Zn-finger protein
MNAQTSGISAGGVNLTCRHCNSMIDILDFPKLKPESMMPDRFVVCPYCQSGFSLDTGVLQTLYQTGDIEANYFRIPLTPGGRQIDDFNGVKVGETRPVPMNNIHGGCEYTSLFITGASRKGVDEENWLPFEIADAKNQVRLGDNLLITVVRTGPTNLSINATLREDRDGQGPISLGDEIDVSYRATVSHRGVTNPTWIDLLVDAQHAIQEDNLFAAIPLLRSAVDNCLIRQMILYYRWEGHDLDSAIDEANDLEKEYLNRYTIAKHGLEEASGTRLDSGPYDDLWKDFDNVVQQRDSIIHCETDPYLEEPDETEVINLFNTTIAVLVAAYELFEFPDGTPN